MKIIIDYVDALELFEDLQYQESAFFDTCAQLGLCMINFLCSL